MKVDTPYLIAGAVGLLAILGGLAFWIWGGGSADPATPTQTAANGECVAKETYEVSANDYVLGKADAPLTIIEYASMTCIHCARFSRDVYPTLKSEYIDTGYVRYVFREFPLDEVALTASVVGRCLARDQYLSYVELMYHELENWAQPADNDLRGSIKEMARRAGMSGDDFEKCLSTETDAKKVVEIRSKANADYCISGTPYFLLDGKKLFSGEMAWSELDDKLRAALKAKGVELPAKAPAAPATAPADGAVPPADGTTPAAPADGAAAPAPTTGAATPPAATPPATTPPATTPAPASGTPTP
ncbi:MAG: thioredoxin domain-containing protein [Alphaproteobacteria bacterium]|nr:thioredoxin domain-containing protein [Alphaproteobacteria bacterium]